jgi:hypothetical protein
MVRLKPSAGRKRKLASSLAPAEAQPEAAKHHLSYFSLQSWQIGKPKKHAIIPLAKGRGVADD